ncbi:MAG: hypothetical protein RR446_06765 [Lachnospiraceae bacterium]
MKKKLAVIAIVAAMTIGSTMTAFAADASNPAGGNSDVYVGVTTTTPENVSVTVPTNLAIAVVSDQTAHTVDTLMGNYMVGADGTVTNGGDAAQGIKEQRVTFVNTGTVNAKVVSAKVVNSYGSKWTLQDSVANTTADKYKMSMKFNNIGTGTIAPDKNATINLNNYALPANQTTHMPAEVKAGGADTDYTATEASAKTFVVEWNIQAN